MPADWKAVRQRAPLRQHEGIAVTEFNLDDPAGKLALLTVTVAAIWKLWLRLRHDSREDRAEAREHAAEGDVITVLREEVARLSETVQALAQDIEEERRLRYAAEREAAELRGRVDQLERRLRDLGHTP